MTKPLYYSLISESTGYIYTIRFKVVPLESDMILPPFTSKVVKSIAYTLPCFSQIRGLYESKITFKPVTFKVLRRGSRRLYVDGESNEIIKAKMGEPLVGEIAVFTDKPLDLGLLSECNTKARIPNLTSQLLIEIANVTFENINTITLNLDEAELIKITFHTPTLIPVKLMTPPALKGSKLVKNIEKLYRLTITPAYICSEAARLWLALVKDVNPAQSPTPYYLGRICDITIGEVDVQLKPTTTIYGKDEKGNTLKVRGITGHIVYKILTPRLILTVDKLLALTTKLGLGKSRSIGFGEVETKSQGTQGKLKNTT